MTGRNLGFGLAPLARFLREMPPDGVGHHVFGELVVDDLLVGLVDLDHFLDAPGDVIRKHAADGLRRHLAHLQKIFGR